MIATGGSQIPTTRAWILAALVTAAPLAGISLAGEAQAGSDVKTHVDTVHGVDTVVFELTTEEGTTLQGDSHLVVTGTYPSDQQVQRSAAMGGLVQFARNEDCSSNGSDPCFIGIHGQTIEDVAVSTQPEGNGDLYADTGPGVDASVDTGHDHESYQSTRILVAWNNTVLPARENVTKTVYNLFVTIPRAQTLSVDLRLVGTGAGEDGDLRITGQRYLDAGFTRWTDDMRPVSADTAAASAHVGSTAVCGQGCGASQVGLPTGSRMYAAFSPSQNGDYIVHSDPTGNYCENCMGSIPATFVGNWGVETPRAIVSATGVGAAWGATPPPIVTVAGAVDKPNVGWDNDPVRFFVDNYVSVGPQDLVAVGFVGPQDPA